MSFFHVARVSPVVLTLALAFGCHNPTTSTMRVKTNSAVVESVAQYRTYSHETADQAPAGYVATPFTPDVLEKVRRRIDVEMEKRGYVVVVPSGDLVVRISSGVRVVTDSPTGRAAIEGAPVEWDRLGSLVIDIFERNKEGHLFHGYARDEVYGDRPKDVQIDEAVTKILAPLPSRTPTL